MKRIATIAAVITAVAVVVPTATAGNSSQSKAQQAKAGTRAQPRISHVEGGTTLWWAGDRLMY